jgi:hypothetical protein
MVRENEKAQSFRFDSLVVYIVGSHSVRRDAHSSKKP